MNVELADKLTFKQPTIVVVKAEFACVQSTVA